MTQFNYKDEVIVPIVIPYFQANHRQNFIYQQDGASAHYAISVRNELNSQLNGRWIGRRGSIEWPARSPDLTPLDFFLWGYLKNKVYSQPIRDKEHLKEVIKSHCTELKAQLELLRRVTRSVPDRIENGIAANGGHFEDK